MFRAVTQVGISECDIALVSRMLDKLTCIHNAIIILWEQIRSETRKESEAHDDVVLYFNK